MSYVHRFAILFASALFLGGCGGSDELTCPSDGPVRPVQIAAGNSHTCARFSDGTVRCWGLNDFGQVGAGADVTQASPHLVSGIHCAAGMALGFGHTCVLLVDGTVRCWGRNEEGELGTGSREGSRVPQQPNLGGVVAITAGANGTGALLSSGSVGEVGREVSQRTSPMRSRCRSPTWPTCNSSCWRVVITVGSPPITRFIAEGTTHRVSFATGRPIQLKGHESSPG